MLACTGSVALHNNLSPYNTMLTYTPHGRYLLRGKIFVDAENFGVFMVRKDVVYARRELKL
jgi:hypothetical protein